MELRTPKRYYLQAPVFFSWRDSHGSSKVGEGVTRDISMQAAFVIAAECPFAGQHVKLDILLPSLSGNRGVRLRGDGVVLRVDCSGAGIRGFAVATSLHSGTRDSRPVLLDMDEGGEA